MSASWQVWRLSIKHGFYFEMEISHLVMQNHDLDYALFLGKIAILMSI